MICKFCERKIENKGSLMAHQNYCKENPNRIIKKRSPNAGRQKGQAPWNKGIKNIVTPTDRSIQLIKSGEYRNLCEQVIRRHMKRLLLQYEGHRCSICGVTDWCGQPVPLICDHIDGNSENSELTNFRLVCANCDCQLPTFKSKNKGKGRKYDREYKRVPTEVGSSNGLENRGD